MKRPHASMQGTALISAMVTVTLVASLASAALWQQWRHVEIEAAERSRAQSAWLLTGALDFTRLVLREDKGPADHLAEPWALGLQESKLSAFLAQDQSLQEGDREVYLSGEITDAQSRLNVMNLIENGQPSSSARASFAKLFTLLGLPLTELEALQQQLLLAYTASFAAAPNPLNASNTSLPSSATLAPLMPQRTEQLVWLGLSERTLSQLTPFISLLPQATPLNLNTAAPETVYASLATLDMAGAQRFVRQRANLAPLQSLQAASKALGVELNEKQHSIETQYFLIRGRIRLDETVQEDQLLVQRKGQQISILWRDHGLKQLASGPGPAGLLQSGSP